MAHQPMYQPNLLRERRRLTMRQRVAILAGAGVPLALAGSALGYGMNAVTNPDSGSNVPPAPQFTDVNPSAQLADILSGRRDVPAPAPLANATPMLVPVPAAPAAPPAPLPPAPVFAGLAVHPGVLVQAKPSPSATPQPVATPDPSPQSKVDAEKQAIAQIRAQIQAEQQALRQAQKSEHQAELAQRPAEQAQARQDAQEHHHSHD